MKGALVISTLLLLSGCSFHDSRCAFIGYPAETAGQKQESLQLNARVACPFDGL